MKAVLLVAGLGTRLRPLTDTIPKCLLPICGRPLLQVWLEKLEKIGIEEVLLNTHWLNDQVEAFVEQERKRKTITIKTFHEPVLLGSAGTLLANKKWLDDGKPFFIIYGDNLTWVDLEAMKNFHLSHGFPITLGVFRAPHPERCGIAEIDSDGIVTSFTEKPEHPKSNLAAGGIYIADGRIFGNFPDDDGSIGHVVDLGFDIFPKLVGKMKCFEIEELIDIGTPEAYETAKRIWQKKRKGKK